ncbi:MAG: hypothetical protein QM811_07935 [Pirellulales bacterium]
MAFALGDREVRFIEGMRHASLTRPSPGGNPPWGLAGHVALAQGRLRRILLGEPNPTAAGKPDCDGGTDPRDDAHEDPPRSGTPAAA